MTVPLEELHGEVSMQALEHFQAVAEGKQALAIGPGLGAGKDVSSLVRRLIQDTGQPVVVDADGLPPCGDLAQVADVPLGDTVGEEDPEIRRHAKPPYGDPDAVGHCRAVCHNSEIARVA